jgi:hypothetical protein
MLQSYPHFMREKFLTFPQHILFFVSHPTYFINVNYLTIPYFSIVLYIFLP